MIELRVLGPISLKRSDGSNVTPLLSQPKRLAFAAYLASPPPHGGRCLHRKDSLLAMFWPELDQQHARAALRNTLYFLRQHLGSEAVRTEHDVVGIDPQALWCDVDAFDVAVRVRDYATTYQLYRGELLEGLCISDAEPFDEWLDAQRRRRSAEAREAVTQAARRHAAAGRVDDAMIWARRARDMDLLNEDAARLLIALRYVTGDRAGALDEYNRLEAHLEETHGVPPSADSQKLAKAIRDPHADPTTVVHAIAQVPLHPSISKPAAPILGIGDAKVHDRNVLAAFMQTRVGLARRRGARVGLLLVSLRQEGKTGVTEDDQEQMRLLERAVVAGTRAADLVARIDTRRLVILPADDGAVDVNALVGRMDRQLEDDRTASSRSRSTQFIVEWLDPSSGKQADELLAEVLDRT